MSPSLPSRTRLYRHHHLDSTRWDAVRLRPDDIIVSTSAKAGTTWMQRILSLLIFGTGPLPGVLTKVSPWIDCRYTDPLDEVVARIEGQDHRRFLKTHLPVDALPFDEKVRYVVVGRDTRDVFMSLWNHYRSYTEVMYAAVAAGDPPGEPLPRCPDDLRWLWSQWLTRASFPWESDGWPFWSHHYHAAAWWEFRHLENVLLVHYNDLHTDLEAEMRRVAAHIGADVAEESWPALVDAARFDAMKADGAALLGPMDRFAGGADAFLYKGTNGRWRAALTPVDLGLYDAVVGRLDPGLRAWLEGGRSGQPGDLDLGGGVGQ
ncbi:MAG TPA: sulfotransferase domain-containing protein [Acidimicrobiia bacterium]|nr:sulfotransferase domain-containing protein [Acidimicrobiia bacterium]